MLLELLAWSSILKNRGGEATRRPGVCSPLSCSAADRARGRGSPG